MSKTLFRKFLQRGVRRGRLGVVYADGSADTFGQSAEGFPEIVLRLTDDRVPRDVVLDPRLGAAEAYMDGRLVIEEGDVMGLVTLLRANNAWDRGGDLPKPRLSRRLFRKVTGAAEKVNDAVRSKNNVAHHYDIGNDFYALMLDDEHWQYSCAYWPSDDMTLAEAQRDHAATTPDEKGARSGTPSESLESPSPSPPTNVVAKSRAAWTMDPAVSLRPYGAPSWT